MAARESVAWSSLNEVTKSAGSNNGRSPLTRLTGSSCNQYKMPAQREYATGNISHRMVKKKMCISRYRLRGLASSSQFSLSICSDSCVGFTGHMPLLLKASKYWRKIQAVPTKARKSHLMTSYFLNPLLFSDNTTLMFHYHNNQPSQWSLYRFISLPL